MLLGLSLVAAPAAANRQPAAPNCENWNTDEFFRTATAETVGACLAAGADVAARTDEGSTPLHMAAIVSSRPAVIKALLAAGADIEAQDGTGTEDELTGTPLLLAAARGHHSAVVEALLEAGADIQARTNGAFALTALHCAAWHNSDYPALIEPLVAAGADPNALVIERHGAIESSTGLTPLHLAAAFGNNPAMVEALISAGADPRARQDDGRTPLHQAAAESNSPAVVEALIASGAEIDTRDDYGRTSLHLAAQNNQNLATIRALLAAGAEIRSRTDDGLTPLHLAASSNEEPGIIEVLLDAGADLKARTSDGSTPLHLAAESNKNPAVVDALLAAGADPAAQREKGATPLGGALLAHWRQDEDAKVHPRMQTVALALLDAGADPNASTGYSNDSPWAVGPLHIAAMESGRAESWTRVVRAMLAAGADPEHRPSSVDYVSPWPPLIAAAGRAHRETVEALLAAGADPNGKFEPGFSEESVLSYAAGNPDDEVVSMLLNAGANPMFPGVLHQAALNENHWVLRFLLEAGADPHAFHDGETPLHVAATRSNAMAVKILLAAGANVRARMGQASMQDGQVGDTPLHSAARAAFNMIEDDAAIESLLAAGADPNATNEKGETPWDLVQQVLDTGGQYDFFDEEDLVAKQEELKRSAAYWRLNDARFDSPANANGRLESTTSPASAGRSSTPASQVADQPKLLDPAGRAGRGDQAAATPSAECLIPGFPSPADAESLGFSWCPASVGFQVRVFAISAAGAQCAIATGSSSTPEQIAARNNETADLCARLDTLTERLGTGDGPDCRCPAAWR